MNSELSAKVGLIAADVEPGRGRRVWDHREVRGRPDVRLGVRVTSD